MQNDIHHQLHIDDHSGSLFKIIIHKYYINFISRNEDIQSIVITISIKYHTYDTK